MAYNKNKRYERKFKSKCLDDMSKRVNVNREKTTPPKKKLLKNKISFECMRKGKSKKERKERLGTILIGIKIKKSTL